MLNDFFKLRGDLSKRTSTLVEVLGIGFLIVVWELVTYFQLIPNSLLPPPHRVVYSFYELHFEDALIRNVGYSLEINILGYLEAIFLAVPIGFVLGLFPVFREMFNHSINTFRFLPLTALTGLFIAWFGIETNMKVHFLAFGIIVYLLPIVIQRIKEVENVYTDTAYTLGATSWQQIRYIFIPSVLAKISDDLKIILAISWTYIIAAEVVNKTAGGVGALAYTCARQSRIDKVFALLLIIILIGFIQDKFFTWLDRLFFQYKHVKTC